MMGGTPVVEGWVSVLASKRLRCRISARAACEYACCTSCGPRAAAAASDPPVHSTLNVDALDIDNGAPDGGSHVAPPKR